jgi:hypothetical protein
MAFAGAGRETAYWWGSTLGQQRVRFSEMTNIREETT